MYLKISSLIKAYLRGHNFDVGEGDHIGIENQGGVERMYYRILSTMNNVYAHELPLPDLGVLISPQL